MHPHSRVASRLPLFDTVALPDGFLHADEFLDTAEEAALLERFRTTEFHEVRMRGVAARRRVVQFGWKYSFETFRMTAGPELPAWLIRCPGPSGDVCRPCARETVRSAGHRGLTGRHDWLASRRSWL